MNRKAALLWRLCLFALVVLLFSAVPTRVVEAHSLCIIYHLTGYRCPTCGMTRAFSNAMHFDISRAISFNPLILLFYPLFWFLFLDDIAAFCSMMRGRSYRSLLERFWYRRVQK